MAALARRVPKSGPGRQEERLGTPGNASEPPKWTPSRTREPKTRFFPARSFANRRRSDFPSIFVDFWSDLGDFEFFDVFRGSGGVWNGLKWSVGPVRSISQSPFLISTILDPFRLDFGCPQGKLLGAFGAWGETFHQNRPWDLEPDLEL